MISVATINTNILKVCTIRNKQVSGQSCYRFTFWTRFGLVGALF